MKYFTPFFAFLGFLIIVCAGNLKAQVVIARDVTITAPPAPSPTSTASIDLSNGSIEYLAENEIILKDITVYPSGPDNFFWVQPGINPGSNYFLAKIIPPTSYAELKERLDGSFCGTIANTLYFKYTEKYNPGLLKYQIYDYQRNEMIPLASQTGPLALTKTLGDNFFSLNLSASTLNFVGTTDSDSFYILEVENDKGEKFYLRFKYLTSVNY